MKKIKYENLVKFHKLSLKQTESDDTIVNEFHNMSERVSVEFRFLDEKQLDNGSLTMQPLNIVVIGTGMFATGRGTQGFGTVLPAISEWKRSGNNIGKV